MHIKELVTTMPIHLLSFLEEMYRHFLWSCTVSQPKNLLKMISNRKEVFIMNSVGVIMGSISDWETMKSACEILNELDIPFEKEIISAHRTPDDMFNYADSAKNRGLKVIIAGAGGAAHLPGMIAAKTTLPVIGVPVQSKSLNGLDSLLSIVQMPGGVPVATVAIGSAGAKNAGILAAQILAAFDDEISTRLIDYQDQMKKKVDEMREQLATK